MRLLIADFILPGSLGHSTVYLRCGSSHSYKRKDVFIMKENYYIGIDVGKFNHCAAIMSNLGEVKEKPFYFSNDIKGFKLLIEKAKPYLSKSTLFGMEDTAHYADNLRMYLLNQNKLVAMINPLTTDAIRKAQLITAKNDKLDSISICQILMNPTLYRKIIKEDFEMHNIRELTRYHHRMQEACSRYKLQLQKALDKVFPEFNSLFSLNYGPTYMRILEKFQSADTIANTDIRSLHNALKHEGRGRSVSFSAEQLKSLAKSSIGQPDLILEMEIKHLVGLINSINTNIAEIDKKIEEFSNQLNSPILSISGISHLSGTSIIAELNNLKNFTNASQVIRYAGVNPIVYQSGNFNATMTRLSKKGSKYLRKTLYQIIIPVIENNPVFKSYYNKKIAEGKSHRCAQGHCIRKLLRVIFHLIKTGESFDPELIK